MIDPIRDAAAQALRHIYQGTSGGSIGVDWDDLSPDRREVWRVRADQIIAAVAPLIAARELAGAADEVEVWAEQAGGGWRPGALHAVDMLRRRAGGNRG